MPAASTRASSPGDNLFGPLITPTGVTFRLWTPDASAVEVLVSDRPPLTMQRDDDGFFVKHVDGVLPGMRYCFRAGDLTFPDLASRQQDTDADGWSLVRGPLRPLGPHIPVRPWHESIICEVHVGAATPDGTFLGLRDKLEHFADAGYTSIELMPINEFPGSRNWGYDGTLIFAPEHNYGSPDDLCALIDRAHDLRLTMLLDVVYNHFGENDNFVERYAPSWFDPDVSSPWGRGINFSDPVIRRFYYENARMWLAEYGFDGLRFDAVHEIKSRSRDVFLGELAQAARLVRQRAQLVTENVENTFKWLERNASDQPMTYTSQWNEDLHHALVFLLTGEAAKTGYNDPDKDPYADLEKALTHGVVHDRVEGEHSDGRTRGGPDSKLPPDCFVNFIQNHDQLGNRADAKRLADRISPERLDFANFVTFLCPQIPLWFMGDEANLSSGLPFFVDLPEERAIAVRAQRYTQMREMFQEQVDEGALPEVNAPDTLSMAKLRWQDYAERADRKAALTRFMTLGQWRRKKVWPLSASGWRRSDSLRAGNCFIINWTFSAATLSMALNPTDDAADLPCRIIGEPVSSGGYRLEGDKLYLRPWSAVVWAAERGSDT